MDRKEAKEHITFIKHAIVDLGYDCMAELMQIKHKYANGMYNTNQELHNATSRMMCNARHRLYG